MIDYYLHKKCPLLFSLGQQKEDIRCKACIWLNENISKCLFSLEYPYSISTEEIKKRIKKVNNIQQNNLAETFRRFCL